MLQLVEGRRRRDPQGRGLLYLATTVVEERRRAVERLPAYPSGGAYNQGARLAYWRGRDVDEVLREHAYSPRGYGQPHRVFFGVAGSLSEVIVKDEPAATTIPSSRASMCGRPRGSSGRRRRRRPSPSSRRR
jgi:hypothetical protein